jgi:flagellar biosynthesis protein FliR
VSHLLALYLDQFLIFVLVLTRLGSLLMTLPMLGTSTVPMQVRALLAVSISLILTPLFWGQPIPQPENLMILGTLLAREAILGLALGLAVLILLSGMQLAGQIVSQTSGMTLADEMLAIAVFFLVGGHRQVMDALLRSFTWMPPGAGRLPDSALEALAAITSQSFDVGIRAAAPVLVALLLATLVVALISRTLPQLNAVAVGLNFNSLIALGVFALCLGSAAWVFQNELETSIDAIMESLAIPSSK